MTGEQAYDISITNVWYNKTPGLCDQIFNTWIAAGIKNDPAQLRARTQEVVHLAWHGERIIGISTAYYAPVPRLRNHMFVIRNMLVQGYRIPGLLPTLTTKTIHFLETIAGDYNPRPLGVIAEIENKRLQKNRQVTGASGMNFIGFSDRGNPIRACFFKGAEF